MDAFKQQEEILNLIKSLANLMGLTPLGPRLQKNFKGTNQKFDAMFLFLSEKDNPNNL